MVVVAPTVRSPSATLKAALDDSEDGLTNGMPPTVHELE